MIPYGKQVINEEDIRDVVAVLNSEFLTQGPLPLLFEERVSDFCGAKYGVVTNSATSSLHLACLALGLGKGDLLWTSATTFVASANCALYCGASVDFIDIDPNTFNISVDALEEKLIKASFAGLLPKIVVPVHMCGQPCEMRRIKHLSDKYGFKIIEDASHALGAKYEGFPIGDGRYSDVTIFSFHPVKMITSGEGGIAVTNDILLADLMRQYRSHGITSNLEQMAPRPQDEIWNYQQISLGFNYRMTDILAALGLSQLNRLHLFVESRRQIASIYNSQLAKLPIKLPWEHPDCFSSFHLYQIRIDEGESGRSQRHIYDALQGGGVNVNLHYIPVYRQPYYETLGFKVGYCPESEKHFKQVLSIPIFPGLSRGDQDKVISIISEQFS